MLLKLTIQRNKKNSLKSMESKEEGLRAQMTHFSNNHCKRTSKHKRKITPFYKWLYRDDI